MPITSHLQHANKTVTTHETGELIFGQQLNEDGKNYFCTLEPLLFHPMPHAHLSQYVHYKPSTTCQQKCHNTRKLTGELPLGDDGKELLQVGSKENLSYISHTEPSKIVEISQLLLQT